MVFFRSITIDTSTTVGAFGGWIPKNTLSIKKMKKKKDLGIKVESNYPFRFSLANQRFMYTDSDKKKKKRLMYVQTMTQA